MFSSQNLSDIQFVNSQVGYAIDWSGNIYKTENGGNISSVTNILEQSLFNIYPNPFSTHTIFQTDLFLKNATLMVENCFGQTVKQIKNINGETITLYRDNLPNGLYFIRLIQDNKIIKVDKLIITDWQQHWEYRCPSCSASVVEQSEIVFKLTQIPHLENLLLNHP